MTSGNRSLLILFVYLAVVYNLEKLGLLIGINLTFFPIFYITMTVAVLVILALLGSIKIPLVAYEAGWIIIYFIGRRFFYPSSPFWMGMNIYQLITEITLLAIAIALAYHLANKLNQIEELGRMITLPSSVRQVRNFTNAIEDIKVEFVRSRRYNHPLSLMIIEPTQYTMKEDMERIIRDNQKRISRKLLTSRLAEVIIHQARRTDMIMTKNWDGRFIVLCPENDSSGASVLAKRIQTDLKNNLGISIHYGIADFPTDALTLEELIRRAETNMTTIEQNPQIIQGQIKDSDEYQTSSDQKIIGVLENEPITYPEEEKPLDLPDKS